MNIKEPSLNSEIALYHCNSRIKELEKSQLPEHVDSQYIKNLNANIFQDMASLGIEYPAGQFRAPSPVGDLNISLRPLSNGASIYCMRSFMDDKAKARFENVLDEIDASRYGKMTTADITKKLSELYTALDYTHPFVDGNSRTFRTFTRQVAKASGYELDWNKTAQLASRRDDLYCARALGAARQAISDPSQKQFEDYIRNMMEDINYPSPRKELGELFDSLHMITPFRALEFKAQIQKSIDCAGNDARKFERDCTARLAELGGKFPEIKNDMLQASAALQAEFKRHEPLKAYSMSLRVLLPAYGDLLNQGHTNLQQHQLENSLQNRVAADKKSHQHSKAPELER